MKKKYIKLNDNYSHLSLGNVISTIKDESKNKSSAIQSEVFYCLFNSYDTNESTINNYCIGSRSIGNQYKQIYINLKSNFSNNRTVFLDIICNILSILNGSIYNIKDINAINKNDCLIRICNKLYNISKNDFYVPKDYIIKFRSLIKDQNYYNLFFEFLCYAILEKKQPLYEEERLHNMIETILQNTDISVNDLQNFLILELQEGINFGYSIKNLANNNNSYANYHLGVLEYRGDYNGTPRYYEAFDYFKKASLNNHPSAYWMMGNMILKQKVYTTDPKKAIEYFNKAVGLGNVAALNSLGLCYKMGFGVKKDETKALEYFKKAADKNYAYGLNNMALFYEANLDFDKSYEFFLKSANLGESFACNRIGEYERKNNNYLKAFEYYNKALDSNVMELNIWAYYNLAKYFYLNGNIDANIPKNEEKAIDYFEKSSNLIESLIELLKIYYDKKDDEKINLYKRLIENHIKYNVDIKKKVELFLIKKDLIIIK